MTRTSVACRTCHAGWWSAAPPLFCPRCGFVLVVTGQVEQVPLHPAR